jgi:hypothetical protein
MTQGDRKDPNYDDLQKKKRRIPENQVFGL